MPVCHIYCFLVGRTQIKRVGLYIKVNFISFDRQWYSLQFFAHTGASNAFTGINHKQCIMGGALY